MIKLDMSYYYKGSSNVSLTLKETTGGVDLITDFGETVTTVTTGYGLMRVLEDLYDEKYT